jgi:outer membrane protein OmpA-like peptidoglycan-associated protein
MTHTQKHPLAALALAATLALAACGSVPADNAALINARAAYANAQSSEQTRELAGAELAAASAALSLANDAFKRGDRVAEVDHLAYLASQRIAVAQLTARQKAADAQLATAEAERDRTRLAARTSEVDAAQRQAQLSREQADAALRMAQGAQLQTADAQARTLQAEEQLRALNAKQTERGMVVTIGDVLFDTGRAELKNGSVRDMGKLAEFFRANPQRTAMVEGFTDSVGGTAANQALSDQRADAVRTALVGMGVARERINVQGYGEAFPVAGNDNAGGRQMNRRVEVVLSDDSGKVKPR